jgi:hypothetical protein
MYLPSFWPSITKSQLSVKTNLKINPLTWKFQSRPDFYVKQPLETRVCRCLRRKCGNWIPEYAWITIMIVISRGIYKQKYWFFSYVLDLSLFPQRSFLYLKFNPPFRWICVLLFVGLSPNITNSWYITTFRTSHTTKKLPRNMSSEFHNITVLHTFFIH